MILQGVNGHFIRTLNQFKKSSFVRYASASQFKLTEYDVEEVKIPMPWGHIAGKWWGKKSSVPILAIHGWQDNANSFDKLIPLLKVPSVLAIDLPGHGLSSHLPEGKAYDFQEHIIMLHRIKKHFNWPQMSLLTHSFGGALGYAYTSIFSGEVKYLINFECGRALMTLLRANIHSTMSQGMDALLKIEKQKKEKSSPAYKLSEMIKMSIEGSLGSIASPEAAYVLLKRGIHVVDKPSDTDNFSTHPESSDLKDFVANEAQAVMSLKDDEKEHLYTIFSQLMDSVKEAKEKLKSFPLSDKSKWWGSRNQQTVLCLHGWQDNANTFNKLIPYLTSDFSYLAVDLPGHGLSSHFPKGFFYRTHEMVRTIRRLQLYFDWDKLPLIGHSYGAACSFLFSALFPNSVDFFVAIDTIKPLSKNSADEIKNASKKIEKMLLLDSWSLSSAPLYNRDDLLQKWVKGSNNSLTVNSCQILMERGTITDNGLLKLTRDFKIKTNFATEFSQKEILTLAESIICPVLFLKATNASYFEKKENVLDIINVIKKKTKYFEQHTLPGTHHIHLNNPELVAPVINSFKTSIAKY